MRSSPNIPRAALGALLVAAVVWCAACDSSSSPTSSTGSVGDGTVRVSRVVDGDTIVVDLGDGGTDRVRFIGIDTPETKSPTKPVQCFGKAASSHTTELLAPGTEVRLERDVEDRDQYGRLLAYVYRVSDGLFVNLELARDGFASLLTYPPNVAHEAEFQSAVDDARSRQVGLWGQCGGPGRPASVGDP